MDAGREGNGDEDLKLEFSARLLIRVQRYPPS